MTIQENTFAAACYDQNSLEELIEALNSTDADESDCKNWGISAQEWKNQIVLAIKEKLEDAENEIDSLISSGSIDDELVVKLNKINNLLK